MVLSSLQRFDVVRAAKLWMGTPYHHQAAVKGAGADCACFPIAVYKECGVLPADYFPPEYSTQWHLHRSEELYLREVERFWTELPYGETPQPGDYAVFHFGRTYSHGAIVVEWPLIIHSYIPHGVTLADAVTDGQLIGRRAKFFEVHKWV